jgi:excisionase family DNA binding protein
MKLMSARRAAEELGLSGPTVAKLIYLGELPASRVGTGDSGRQRFKIRRDDVNEFIERRRVRPASEGC